MIVPNVNFVAVVISAVISMVIGMLWYGPLFGKKWMELTGKKMGEMGNKEEMPKLYVAALAASLVAAYMLAVFIKFVQAATPVDGAITGFWVWLGFIATVSLNEVLWGKRPLGLYLLNNGHELVNFAIIGAIIAAMG